jgi:predicted ATPase/DNA-binding SARP family transcriptional activator
MPPRLVLQFLGLPQIYIDDQPIATDRRKAIALLAYMAVNDVGQTHQKYSRESLSALLWPDYEQAKAFSNLRRTIWEVHQAIGENWFIAERESIHLNADADPSTHSAGQRIDLDVTRFQGLLSQGSQQNDPALRIPLFVEATKLYRNHFLTGFSLKDAYPFNEWAFAESEELRRQLLDALTLLLQDYCTLGEADKAIPYGRRLIALDPLNESAHRQLMEVYLQAGQHSAALKQYQTCEQLLRKELNLDPQPETRALYKKIRKGEVKPVRVEKQIETFTPRHNLPSQLSTFIGREKEQEEIIDLLENNRLVTLAGVGGIGKTRLSLQVGRKLLNDYPGGVWFVPLDSLSNPALVPTTVAAVFDIREGPDRPVVEILINKLRDPTTLLIFDNCEHLLDACAQLITGLLANCPNLKTLTTSREILNLNGEATYFLPPLSLPEDNKPLAENLTEYESVQLFTDRATLAQSSFRLTQVNARTVVNICRRVDGIPLAIELAAARVNILQVREILKQLGDSFSLLAGDTRGMLPRHETLQASVDWSWGLLTKDEQNFLRQLSVFAGGWTLESSRAVCDGDILALTNSLVKKSLIMVEQESERETRYRFHEIVRQYMRERLRESSEEQNIGTRHLNYFLQLSEQAEPALRGSEQRVWHARLRDDRDNIRAALEWAVKTDVEAGLYMTSRLRRYWESFDMREGARWLAEFIESPGSKDFPLTKAKALLVYGWILGWMQQHTQARSAALACLELFRACGDLQGEIDGLLLLGYVGLVTDGRKQLRQQALAIAQTLGDTWRQAWATFQLGWSYSGEKQFAYWEQARILMYQTGDWNALATLLSYLGNSYMLNGNLELAQKRLEEAKRLNDQLQDKGTEADLLHARGRMAMIQGDYTQARAHWEEVLDIAEELGSHMNSLWCRSILGYLALYEGKLTEARDIFTETAREFFNDKNEIGVVFNLEGMAGLYIAVGKPETAAQLIGWTDAMREKISDTRPSIEQADVDKIIAACLAKMGEVAFSDAYDEGQKMTLDKAVAYALEEENSQNKT